MAGKTKILPLHHEPLSPQHSQTDEHKQQQHTGAEAYPLMQEVMYSPARFKVVAKGRRAGLTTAMARYIIDTAREDVQRACLWVDVNEHNMNAYVQRYFLPYLRQRGITDYKYLASKRWLRVLGTVVDFRSANRPQSMEGFSYHEAFINEAGIVLKDKYLWHNAIRPMLMDYGGRAVIAGTPKGRNEFYALAQLAMQYQEAQPGGTDWAFWRVTSYENPYIAQAEIDNLAASVDAATRGQEVYGEFTDRGDMAFAYAFDRQRHQAPQTGAELEDRSLPVHLSFDFNVDPATCTAWQHAPDDSWIRMIAEFKLRHASLYQLCQRVRARFPWARFYVTGDATGMHRTANTDGLTNSFAIIRQQLDLPERNIVVARSNPPHPDSRVLLNALLEQHPRLHLARDCPETMRDLELMRADSRSHLAPPPDHLTGHLLDCVRYYCHAFHARFVLRPPAQAG